MSTEEKRRSSYQGFLMRQFQKNRTQSGIRYGLFFYGFNEDHIDELILDITEILERIGGGFKLVNCEEQTYKQILVSCLDKEYDARRVREIYYELETQLRDEADTLVLARFSKAKSSSRPQLSAHARDLLKILGDAHFYEPLPMSNIIMIDRASFLESAWYNIGHLVKIMPRSMSRGVLIDGFDDLKPVGI